LAADGTHVWVGDSGTGFRVTELDAATGALVQVLKGPRYQFNAPVALAAQGTHVWVADSCNGDWVYNCNGGSVTELDAATGALVQVLKRPSYQFSHPRAVAADGTHVWVANYGNSVTEMDAATGALVQVLKGPRYQFSHPRAVAADGTHVWVADNCNGSWVANCNGHSVTELDAATGALVQVLNEPRYQFNGPSAVATDGTHLWVANSDGDSVTEFPASSQ
jgi:DNA-binding beta-propeller fold protein YncE